MKNVKKLFWTTILLTASSFAMKTVGVWFNVYLSNQIGAEGIGLWNLILSVYFMLKTLGAAGINLVSTRLVIDEPNSVNSNLKKLYAVALIPGCAAMLVLFFAAQPICSRILETRSGAASLRLLSLSLPFIALSSVTGGYSTAQRKMSRYALIQMAEQGVRIGVSILALSSVASGDLKTATFCSALGITVGEMFSFFTGFSTVLWDRKRKRDPHPTKGFGRKFRRIALPDGAGSIFRSLLSTLQNLLIPKGMKQNGATEEQALASYGRVHGMALPVILYPSSILGVLSGLLVPEIAHSKAKGQWGHIRYIIYRVLHLALLFSLGVTGAMLGFPRELSLAVYGSEEAADFIRILAPLIPVMYMDMTSDGLLKGLDMQRTIMAINVADSVLSVILIWLLVPVMGIYGYVFMVFFTEGFNFIFSFAVLIKAGRFSLSSMKSSLLLFLLMPAALLVTKALLLPLTFSNITLECVTKISCCTVLYFLFALAAGSLSKEDLSWFQKLVK